MCVYIELCHFAVQQKLIEQCKSTIIEKMKILKKKRKKKKNGETSPLAKVCWEHNSWHWVGSLSPLFWSGELACISAPRNELLLKPRWNSVFPLGPQALRTCKN